MATRGYGYNRPYPSTITDLIMEGGRQRAEGAERMGDILSRGVSDIGGGLTEHFQQRDIKRAKEAEQEAI